MKIYLTLGSIPELATLSRKRRGRVWRECYLQALGEQKIMLVAALVAGLCTALGGHVGALADNRLVGLVAGGGIGAFIYSQLAIRAVLPYIRRAVTKDR